MFEKNRNNKFKILKDCYLGIVSDQDIFLKFNI